MQPYQTGQNHLNQKGLRTSETCASSVLRAPDIMQVNSATVQVISCFKMAPTGLGVFSLTLN